MSPTNACRLFAIYLAVLIITESPVGAFTVRLTRTTTIKPFIDLTAEPSALLEVKYDLPKINNVKDNIGTIKDATFITTDKHSSLHTVANILEADNKSTFNNINVATSTVEIQRSSGYETATSQPDVETTTDLLTTVSSKVENTDENGISSGTEANHKGSGGNINTSRQERGNTDEPKTNDDELFTTTDITHTGTDNFEWQSVTKIDVEPTLTGSGVTGTEAKTVIITNDQTETLKGEASSSPSWKTYTTIERKRTTPAETPATVTRTTEETEALANSNTVNVVNTLIPSSTEISMTSIDNLDTQSPANTQKTDQTIPDHTSEVTKAPTNTIGTVSSKRAGFLDLTVKQTNTEESTTSNGISNSFNETELLGAMFDIDDSLENKKSTGIQSQSQLNEDAIKEELMKEQVLNDNYAKSFPEDKIKPTETTHTTTEDTLSVKPININTKSNLYTVSPHYKPMKKIEVQSAKPFIRDPDDNSWRNESLSLLGIVFNAKNASKPFTQVLKNKTEAELNNIKEKYEKNEVTDLRERLEKNSEVRKSKKKKINKFGDTVYSDYEESTSSELINKQKPETVSVPLFDADGKLAFLDRISTTTTTASPKETTTPGVYMYREETTSTTKKPKKDKFPEYYDSTDEYDADYITIPKLDLKKFTTRFYTKETVTTPLTPVTSYTTTTKNSYLPDRKPTIQYFPPLPKTPKVNMNDYDSDFQRKVNYYTYKELPKEVRPVAQASTPPPSATPPPPPPLSPLAHAVAGDPSEYVRWRKLSNSDNNHYVTYSSRAVEPPNKPLANDDETFNRASYVIKHYKDLIDAAVKDDYERNGEYVPAFTETPLAGVTVHDLPKGKSSMDDDYDYVANFRKGILNRFVDNFNQNSERFKVDFPVLYNNSVVHMKADDDGKVIASSSAFLKRLYDTPPVAVARPYVKACEPNCDIKVELSPDYELLYYVPDQEEKEQLEPKAATLPFAYRT